MILCTDQRFSDWFGFDFDAVVGRNFGTLGTDIEAVDR